MNLRLIGLSTVILLALGMPIVSAQTVYVQPMYSISWTSHTILVSVPASPSWAQADFMSAIQDWNEAQGWFLASYEPSHLTARYTLELAQPGQRPQVIVNYVSNLPNGWWAETSQDGTRISLVESHADGNVVLVAHELGHVLGLGDNSISGDLERSSNVHSPYPSTLDLYGAYLQALCQCYSQGDTVGLPAQIPYTVWVPNEKPIPEFSSPAFVLVSILLVIGLTRRRT